MDQDGWESGGWSPYLRCASDDAGQLLQGAGRVLVLLLLAGNREPDDDLARMPGASSRTTRQVAAGVRVRAHAARLQLGEDFGEEARLGVNAQHVRGKAVHDQQTSGSGTRERERKREVKG